MAFWSRKRRVLMIASVGNHVAMRQYRLSSALADSFIVKGYAEGVLSRAFSDDELNALRGQVQIVRLG